KLTDHGFGLIAFDFRGTGESSGSFYEMTISSQAEDLKQVLSFADYTYKVPMIVLGRSLGGSTVLATVSNDDRPVATVLWSTPLAVKEVFAKMLGDATQQLAAGQMVTIKDDYSSYELGAGFWQDLVRHDFKQYVLTAAKQPLLVIHGEADEVVDTANAQEIKLLAPTAQLITVAGADHKFINGWELREEFTVAWLNHLFS
ncbi:MAG: alpha/beta hydrolase, partial [Methanomassiliicoccales archaeon]